MVRRRESVCVRRRESICVRRSASSVLLSGLKNLTYALIILIILYPMYYMLIVTLSEGLAVMKNEVWLYPKGFSLNVYAKVMRDSRIMKAYVNTILYVSVGTAISLMSTVCAAYALSKNDRLVCHRFFSFFILIPMFFGGGMIPTYLVVKGLGLLNSIWAVTLPGAVSCWNLIITRSFFINFPHEIEEAGVIDGLFDYGLLFRVVIPLSKPVLATIGLFYGVGLWNNFFGPFLYLDNQNKFPLQIILRQIVMQGVDTEALNSNAALNRDGLVVGEALKYATIIVSMVPVLIVYPFIQKYYEKGIMIGSIKG